MTFADDKAHHRRPDEPSTSAHGASGDLPDGRGAHSAPGGPDTGEPRPDPHGSDAWSGLEPSSATTAEAPLAGAAPSVGSSPSGAVRGPASALAMSDTASDSSVAATAAEAERALEQAAKEAEQAVRTAHSDGAEAVEKGFADAQRATDQAYDAAASRSDRPSH